MLSGFVTGLLLLQSVTALNFGRSENAVDDEGKLLIKVTSELRVIKAFGLYCSKLVV